MRDRQGYLRQWSRHHGGYDAAAHRWPRRWLSVGYAVAVPLARRGISAHLVTAAGVLVSGAVPVLAASGGRWPLLAAVAVLLTAVADSADGALALLRGTSAGFGRILDPCADRVTESLWVLGFWLLGAPAWACLGAVAGSLALEYLRAVADLADIGVVTVAERPMRVLVALIATVSAGVVPSLAGGFGTIMSVLWLALSMVGLAQLLAVVRRRLPRRPHS